MEYIDITPNMTSNTTPPPFVTSASSEYDGATSAYKAFVGGGNAWFSNRGSHLNAWLKLDYGEKNEKTVHLFTMKSYSIELDYPCWAKEFKLEGSNNDIDWTPLGTYVVDSWSKGEEKRFVCDKTDEKYRYYKFTVIRINSANTSGNSYAYLCDIKLYDKAPPVSQKNANLMYTLPMATTTQIKAKFGDTRAGLLGMANDDENFGDLYVVGKDGKSHLTKSGIKSEILFEGVANNTGVYNLGKSVSTHKFLSIYGDIANGSYSYSMLIAVEELKAKDYIFEIYEQNYLVIRLISDNEIEVKSKYNAGHYDGRITKIIGIY